MLAVIAYAKASLGFSSSAGRITLSGVDEATARFALHIDGEQWFASGSPPSVRSVGKEFVADGKGGPTSLVSAGGPSTSSGTDALGKFSATVWQWTLGPATGAPQFETSVRLYDSAAVFGQRFLTALEGTSSGNKDGLISAFPSLGVVGSGGAMRRGYLQYGGDMTGANFHLGEWDATSSGIGSGITGTAPLCIFDEDLKTSVVLSPFSSFMAASQRYAHGELAYGLMGNVSSVPAGFGVETLLMLSEGITPAMIAWGDALLAKSGKPRMGAWQRDLTLQYLGYSTDNGAYYYYTTEAGKNYEQTILDVAEYAKQQALPYQYWLADSWWYYKGVGDGVKNWTAMTSVFPHGLEYVWQKTGWLVQGHNRYWSADTDYAKQNGGAWEFLVDAKSGRALPVDAHFWDYLMRSSRQWGLAVYEQDWLDQEFDDFPPLTQSATLGGQWLRQMATAADANGLAIQYCMAHSRHILASVELPAVTQARASGDYHPGNEQWRPLGVTGLFAYAVGLAPSKDNFWSTQWQPGSKWGPTTNEPYNRLQAAVLALSKGPVCPSDAVNKSDAALIMRSAAADGTLLQPQRPATKLDVAMLAAALDGTAGPDGEVWFAPSTISGRTYGALLSADLAKAHSLSLAELALPAGEYLAVEANASAAAVPLSAAAPLALAASGRHDFELWSLAPREANGWALLGEVAAKWVAVSPARFSSIAADAASLSAVVRGAPGEAVQVAFAKPGAEAAVVTARCVLPLGGTVRVSAPALSCAPA